MKLRAFFFNWSLKELLATEEDSFNRSKLKIMFVLLVMSLFKGLCVLPFAIAYHQPLQLTRALVAVGAYSVMLKLMLTDKASARWIIHVMLVMGLLIIYSSIFITAQRINIITLQFVFMIVLSAFYFVTKFWGVIYSILSILPVLAYMLITNLEPVHFEHSPEELAAPGIFLITTLNFITLILAHYLYHQAFHENIREKEHLNHQFKMAVESAERLAQSRTDFLSTMSHELRTPLNAVIGMTNLLLDDMHKAERKENLDILHFSATSLHTLINDILDYNKMESDKLHLELIPVNLSELMNKVTSGMELPANEKGLKLFVEMDEGIKGHVIADPTRIMQILYNLLGNGIKFTHEGSVSLSLKRLEEDMNTVKIRFAVSDTGIGIEPDKQQIIFDPFVQASTTTTREYGGTGLGLSIVRKLLVLMESQVYLQSEKGKGSTFFFDIVFSKDTRLESTQPDTEALEYNLSDLRVLMAEDNPMNALLMKKLFKGWNIEPVIADNGLEVIRRLEENYFDVILMDIHMPVMNGYDATRFIRALKEAEKAEIPIIALTASVSQVINEKIENSGMNDYLHKPFDPMELYSKLSVIHKKARTK